MADSKEELKSLLMKVKEDSEKAGLKLNNQKTKIMASGPITSWRIYGETVETVQDFILGGFQVAAAVQVREGWEELLHVQGPEELPWGDTLVQSKEQQLCFTGVAMKRYPTSKVRETQENKVCHCFHCFPIYFPWSDGTRCHDLHFFEFWVLCQLFTLVFHFHQEVL